MARTPASITAYAQKLMEKNRKLLHRRTSGKKKKKKYRHKTGGEGTQGDKKNNKAKKKEEQSNEDNTCRHCRVRCPLIKLNENKLKKNLPLTAGHTALLHLNTRHKLVEPVPCHTMSILFLHSSTAVSIRLSLPPPHSFPLSLLLASTAAWRIQVLSSSPLCHVITKRSAASTPHRYQFPILLAAFGFSTVSVPNRKGGLSIDTANTFNTLLVSSARHWVWALSCRSMIPDCRTPSTIDPNIIRCQPLTHRP